MRLLLAPREVPGSYDKYWEKLVYPLFASPKLDGFRAMPDENGVVRSRTWKPLASEQVQAEFNMLPFVDGELIAGDPTAPNVFNVTSSHVRSRDKPGDISYHLFDYAPPYLRDEPFFRRLEALKEAAEEFDALTVIEQEIVRNKEDLLAFEDRCIEQGYEGVMLKTAEGRYKEGRATINEGIIYKLKRFDQDEGRIVGFIERMVNNNEQTRDEQGYAARSSSKEGKVGANTLGKFLVDFNGEIIDVAPGILTHDDLQEIWDNQDFYEGRLLSFRHFAYGVKDAPRHARAVGIRNEDDI